MAEIVRAADRLLVRSHARPDEDAPDGPPRDIDPPVAISGPVAPPRRSALVAKRCVDIVFSCIALSALMLPMLVLALLVRLESRGSPIFLQERIGLGDRRFLIVKFRTMGTAGCDPSGVAQAVAGDARVTRLGRVLRRTNLDELPQLWNVLVGDMSLVGPRPHVPGMLADGKPYPEVVAGYGLRHRMRPGMTGLAQCHGLRGPTDDRSRALRRIACDVAYIRNFSLLLDLKIMVRTLVTEIRGGTGT
ncbi:sugar transferase [Ensifer soli]|uniref:sugar transferase n=1 Tax=Ciceribacter sp. sgz301302 TaxID=3342379 RepID=UPI0035B7DCDF